MTSLEIIHSLVGPWRSCRWSSLKVLAVVGSCGVSYWETDILVMHPTGYADEIEIKVSVSDFRAELKAKKEKHESLERGYFFVRPRHKDRRYFPNGWDDGTGKIIEQKQVSTIIRRFWFAMPRDVYEKVSAEVPVWAGVLIIEERTIGRQKRHAWTQERAAKLLPCRKVTDEDRNRALVSIYHRAWRRGWAAS